MSALNSKFKTTNEIHSIFTRAAFPSSYTASEWANVRGFRDVEFYFKIFDQQNVTNLYAKIEYTDLHTSARVFPVTVEELDADATPPVVKQYIYRITAESCFSGSNSYFSIPCPTHGAFMRVSFYGGPSVGTDEVEVYIHKKD
jgi:hypothetical protein